MVTVLLHGAESWVLTDTKIRKLKAWQHRAARYITRPHIREDPITEGEWIIPDREETMILAKLPSIEQTIQKKRREVKRYLEMEAGQYREAQRLSVPKQVLVEYDRGNGVDKNRPRRIRRQQQW